MNSATYVALPEIPTFMLLSTRPAISTLEWIQHNDKVDICPCASIIFHQKQHYDPYFEFLKSEFETFRLLKIIGAVVVYIYLYRWVSPSRDVDPNFGIFQQLDENFLGRKSLYFQTHRRGTLVKSVPKRHLQAQQIRNRILAEACFTWSWIWLFHRRCIHKLVPMSWLENWGRPIGRDSQYNNP